jgi:tape measure domain-containing protein
MATTTVGTIQLIATIDTARYKAGAKDIERANNNIERSTDSVDKSNGKITSSLSRVAKVGFAAFAAAGIAAFAAVASHVDDAVKRVDTLNNAPRVLQNLGFSAGDSERAIRALSEGIRGLPTRLDAAASALVNIASASGLGTEESTALTLAFNNMALAGGKGAQEADRALTQFVQSLGRGSIGIQEFNTLSEVMPAQLTQVAKTLLGADANAQTLRDEISEGNVTMDQFVDTILRLDKEGGDGFASFTKQAKDATSGIGTSFENMNAAIIRGVEEIINVLGAGNIANIVSQSGKIFEDVLNGIAFVLDLTIKAIQEVLIWLQPLFDLIGQNQQAFEVLKMTLVVLAGLLLGAIITGIIVVSVAFAVITEIIQAVVDAVESVIQGFIAFGTIAANVVTTVWKVISDTFSNIGKWFSDRFTEAVNAIKRVFGALGGFFRGVWNTITDIFGRVGTAIGDAIGSAFKNVINGILRFAVNTINGFIRAINAVIDTVNNIPGVDLGRIGELPVPQLATGAIVTSATLAMVGEGSEPEAVIPLSKLDEMLNGNSSSQPSIQVTVNASANMIRSETDKREFAKVIFDAFNEGRRARGMGDLI